MKKTFDTILSASALFSFLAAPALAEKAPDVITLISACELQEKLSKQAEVQTATLEGGRGVSLSSALTDSLVDRMKSDALSVQAKIFECYSAEAAYADSQRDHQGVAGASETDRYNTAVSQLTDSVAALTARRTPGLSETLLDVGLNDVLKASYRSWIERFSKAGNTIAVVQLQDRLSEGFASLLQLSIPCRSSNRSGGVSDCPAVTDGLGALNQKIQARLDDVQPRVDAMTDLMAQDQARSDGLAAQMASLQTSSQQIQAAVQQAQGQIAASQQALQNALGNLNFYAYWAQYNLAWYYYCVYLANYFASYGNWPYANAYAWYAYCYALEYWKDVSIVNWWSSYATQLRQQIAVLQNQLMSLQQQMLALQSQIQTVQQAQMSAMMKLENDKAAIKALAVSTLDSDIGFDFGGAWGIKGGTPVNNPATGSPSCTTAFTSRTVSGTKNKDFPLTECARRKVVGQEPTVDFGGFYGMEKGIPMVNAVTGSRGCPDGFSTTEVLGTADVDLPVSVCTRPHSAGTTEPYAYGGMFGYVEGKQSPNPFTASMSCPKGYTAATVYGTNSLDNPLSFCFRVNPVAVATN